MTAFAFLEKFTRAVCSLPSIFKPYALELGSGSGLELRIELGLK